jgi:hypothetical protein
MNAGSSRSHAALILTLRQLDVGSNEVCTTTFNCVDMAGAERPDKTGGARVSALEAFMQYADGKVSMGAQVRDPLIMDYLLLIITSSRGAEAMTVVVREHQPVLPLLFTLSHTCSLS